MSYNRKFYFLLILGLVLLVGGSIAAFSFVTQYEDTTSSIDRPNDL